MPDTEQGHSNLRGENDAVVEGATPTLTEPGTTTNVDVPPPDVAPIHGGITPGTVEHAEDVDQSGQVPPEAAEALPTIEP